MEILLAASSPVRRWSLADDLGLPRIDAMSPAEAHARLTHPVGCSARALILVVGCEDDLELLRRVAGLRRDPLRLVVLAADPEHARCAAGAGADVIVHAGASDHVEQLRRAVDLALAS